MAHAVTNTRSPGAATPRTNERAVILILTYMCEPHLVLTEPVHSAFELKVWDPEQLAVLEACVALQISGNRTTDNWTILPDNRAQLRARWECSHAASARLNAGALIALIFSLLGYAAVR
jgi:hypothetical protein